MEALSLRTLLSSTNNNFPMRRDQFKSKFTDVEFVRLSFNHKKLSPRFGRSQISAWSKKSLNQDFKDFAKPVQLLLATNAKFLTDQKLEKILGFPSWDESCSYILQLHTSNEFGSSIRDDNAAVILGLIDVGGNAIMQRISSALAEDGEIVGNYSSSCDQVHFQRGSVDTVMFSGPTMENVQALWVGLESGSWKLGSARLTVISKNKSSNVAGDLSDNQYNGLQYDFGEKDILLGEGSGTSIAELRPNHVMDFPINNSTVLTNFSHSLPPLFSEGISNAQGMKEYADLKLSLLIYDLLLLSAGATILTFSTTEKFVVAFLLGGISGFLYLLSLQKYVDDLSSSADVKMENIVGTLGGFKGPLSRIVLLLVIFAAAFKYGLGGSSSDLTPQQLLLGSLGFFTCKIAVLLAAFKPLKIDAE